MGYFSGSNVLTLNMRADMPGSEDQREYRQYEDLCTHTGEVDCKCAETALDFLGSEWGPPPTCFLNLKRALYKPEVFAMLEAGLPQAAQAVATAAAGAHLSANLSYLLYLIKMGDSFLNEAAAQVASFINQEKISCALGEQLAEDHLAYLTELLNEARACLATGMERAGCAKPRKKAVMHHQVGNHAIRGVHHVDGVISDLVVHDSLL